MHKSNQTVRIERPNEEKQYSKTMQTKATTRG